VTLANGRTASGKAGYGKPKRKVLDALRKITSDSPLLLNVRDVYSIIPVRWYFEWKKLLAEDASAADLLESISLCIHNHRDASKQPGQMLAKKPHVIFSKSHSRRNAWHQSLHESNVLILAPQTWKVLRNAAGVRDNFESAELQIQSLKEAVPKFSISPPSCWGAGRSGADASVMDLWVYGAFESEASGPCTKTAVELKGVDPGTTVRELKEMIAGKKAPKGTIHDLFYCQTVLQDSKTLLSCGIMEGDLLHFETSKDGELSSDLESGQGGEKNFEGTRLMS